MITNRYNIRRIDQYVFQVLLFMTPTILKWYESTSQIIYNDKDGIKQWIPIKCVLKIYLKMLTHKPFKLRGASHMCTCDTV